MSGDALMLTACKMIYTNGSVCIKGIYSIASYDENMVIIKCDQKSICVSGDKIIITLFSNDEIHISGNIQSISFA